MRRSAFASLTSRVLCIGARPAGGFRVVADKYVTDDSGTGVVHQVRRLT